MIESSQVLGSAVGAKRVHTTITKVVIIGCCLCITGIADVVRSQTATQRSNSLSDSYMLESVKQHHELEVGYEKAVRAKVASRKAVYHLGEMASIDTAVLNTSQQPVFVLRSDPYDVLVKTLSGRSVQLGFAIIVDSKLEPASFARLDPGEMSSQSFHFIIGCRTFNGDVGRSRKSWQVPTEDRIEFENNLFTDMGNGCIDVTRPGTYTIAVQHWNNHVMVSRSASGPKTATGELISPVFRITVVR